MQEILETINGLKLAKSLRAAQVNETASKDDAQTIEEYKAELENEYREKLIKYVDDLAANRLKTVNKLRSDIDIIDELIYEFEAKLEAARAEEALVATESTQSQNESIE